mmetsp:Transcript_47638/g.57673  ORF Transcript_47638/g.57673 Transcript_47638/m.57673 type:complete len:146 (+) Transcript_47638:97-534(+)
MKFVPVRPYLAILVTVVPYNLCVSSFATSIPKRNSRRWTSNSLTTRFASRATGDAAPDEEEQFRRSLEEAKRRLGGEIPPEQAKEAAKNAESDFLAAMEQVSQKFEADKSELGSDGAIDLIKSQWEQEERLMDALDNDDVSGEFE